MKKRFLIISLVVGLFLVMSGGVAVADTFPGDNTFEGEVKIKPDTNDPINQQATLLIIQPEANNPYGNDNDAIPLLMEGANNLNTVSVIRSWGYKDGGTTDPTEAELRFDYGYITYDPANPDLSYMNASIYTQGNDHILRLKPLEPGTGQILQEVQIEGENLGDTILRIAAKGDSEAALTFAKDDNGSSRDAIDTAKIYRPANSNELRIEMYGNYTGDMWDGFFDIMTFKADFAAIAMGLNTTAAWYSSTAMGEYTTANGWASTAMGNWTTASVVSHKRLELFLLFLRERGNVQPG